jgi:hypothetical protein
MRAVVLLGLGEAKGKALRRVDPEAVSSTSPAHLATAAPRRPSSSLASCLLHVATDFLYHDAPPSRVGEGWHTLLLRGGRRGFDELRSPPGPTSTNAGGW